MPLNLSVRETSTTTAYEALSAQIDAGSWPFGVSLDAVWRACGSPADEAPADWLILARGMNHDFNSYRHRLWLETAESRTHPYVPSAPVWNLSARTMAVVVDHLGSLGSFVVGDTMAIEDLAALYAAFLDHRGIRRSTTHDGARVMRHFDQATQGGAKLECSEPTPDALPRAFTAPKAVRVLAVSG